MPEARPADLTTAELQAWLDSLSLCAPPGVRLLELAGVARVGCASLTELAERLRRWLAWVPRVAPNQHPALGGWIEALDDLPADAPLEVVFPELAKRARALSGQHGAALHAPLRIALIGEAAGPPLVQLVAAFGAAETRRRIVAARSDRT